MRITHTLMVAAVALLSLGSAYSASPEEGSYPAPGAVTSGITRAQVQGETARWLAAGSPGQIRGEQRPEFAHPSGTLAITRGDVAADLDLWRRSGMRATDEASDDLGSGEYRAHLKVYNGLVLRSKDASMITPTTVQ